MKYSNVTYLKQNFNLSQVSPLKIQKIAETVFFPSNLSECKEIIKFMITNNKKYLVLGNISNSVILPDENDKIKIPIIITKNLNKFKIDHEKNTAYSEAGVWLTKFAREISNNNYWGFSGLTGFPASIDSFRPNIFT